jgi:arylsulfatase A-like enzyme
MSTFSARWVRLLIVAAAILAAGAAWLASRRPSGSGHPNVVMIVVDTLRADHLGAYGYARPTSPHLDALAAAGVRFTTTRAASSWTAASVASIFTGLYPAVHGLQANDDVLADGLTTLAERFAANGYATAGFSANAAFVTAEQGFAQGFDEFRVLHGEALPVTSKEDKIPLDPFWKKWAKVASADLVTDAGIAWLGTRSAGAPYFLYLHYFDPHAGYFPPPPFRERMGVAADGPLVGAAQWDFWIVSTKFGASPEQLTALRALYDGEIAFVDDEIGRLVTTLQQRGDDPLIVVTSDHGEEFGEHGGLQHGATLFEEQLRIPLIVTGPRIPRGAVVDTPVSLVGLAATLGELAGLAGAATPPPQPSFAGLIGRSPPGGDRDGDGRRAPMFADLGSVKARHRDAVVDGPWKMIRSATERHLYDLDADPGETRDLAATSTSDGDRLATMLDDRARVAASIRIAPDTVPDSALRRARLKALGYAE